MKVARSLSEVDEIISDMRDKLAKHNVGLSIRFSTLFYELVRWLETGKGDDPRPKIAIAFREAFYIYFLTTAQSQAIILGLHELLNAIMDIGVSEAVTYSKRATPLAVTAAKRNPLKMLLYSETVLQIMMMQAIKLGFDAVGVTVGAPFKLFARVIDRKHPRAHSALEGLIIEASGNWNISGYLVPTPRHPSLPFWQEVAFCGHSNIYLMLRLN